MGHNSFSGLSLFLIEFHGRASFLIASEVKHRFSGAITVFHERRQPESQRQPIDLTERLRLQRIVIGDARFVRL